MDREEIRLQVAISCIQGVLEAKLGILGEIEPEIAVAESFRIADEFVRQWYGETKFDKLRNDTKKAFDEALETIKDDKLRKDVKDAFAKAVKTLK